VVNIFIWGIGLAIRPAHRKSSSLGHW